MLNRHGSWWTRREVCARWSTALIAIAAATTIAACGSSSSSSSSAASSTSSAAATTAPAATTGSSSASASGSDPFPSAAAEVKEAGITSWTGFCGKKDITLGVEDGFGTNTFSEDGLAAVRSEAAKCPNVKVIADIAQGSLSTAITQINSLVSQGATAMTVIADFGPAENPVLHSAMEKGVKVWEWAVPSDGTPGTDFEKYIDFPPNEYYVEPALWLGKALKCQGNIVDMSGPAGNPSAISHVNSVAAAITKECPNIHILDKWIESEWTPASAQTAMAAALSKFPNINGVITDYGGDAIGIIKAFQTAGRKLVPIADSSENDVACEYTKLKSTNPAFELGDNTTRSWMGRVAAREAIASAEGVADNEPLNFQAPIYENSIPSLRAEFGGIAPQCQPSQPPSADFSNDISAATVAQYGKPTSG